MKNNTALTLLCLIVAAPAFATVRWTGDFETGNTKQYTKAQMVNANRIQMVTNRVRQGKYSAKVMVQQGDNPINASGNRNELVESTYRTEGTELYYGWSTFFDASYPSAKMWQVFAQWHQIEDSGSPPLQFVVNGETMQFMVSPQQTIVWKTPLVRNQWHDFVLHVKFSNNKNVGFVELWYDGKKVLNKTSAETRANNYLKLGLYRNAKIAQVGIVYHDGMKAGETLAEVMPNPATRVATSSARVAEEGPSESARVAADGSDAFARASADGLGESASSQQVFVEGDDLASPEDVAAAEQMVAPPTMMESAQSEDAAPVEQIAYTD